MDSYQSNPLNDGYAFSPYWDTSRSTSTSSGTPQIPDVGSYPHKVPAPNRRHSAQTLYYNTDYAQDQKMCRIKNIEKPLGKPRCFFGFFAIIEAQDDDS